MTKSRLVISVAGDRAAMFDPTKNYPLINNLKEGKATAPTLVPPVPFTVARRKVLRISIQDGAETATLKFEGKLVGLWVRELDRVWRAFGPLLGLRKLCLDIRGMTFIDERGTKALRKIFRSTEAEILADTPLTRHFAAATMRKMTQNDRKEI